MAALGSTSSQQIDDLRLELRRVVCPIAIDFPRAPAEGATGRRAPRMDRVICGSEVVIASDMSGHGDLACGRLCTDYLAFALKGPNNLNAEVNVHRCITMGGMMVEEAIMPVGSQAFMAAEELPDEIKRRLPDAANVSTERAPPHRGERLRADGFGDNLIIHQRFPLYSFNLGNESCRTLAFSCGARSEFKARSKKLLEKHTIAPSAARLCSDARWRNL